MPYNLVAWSASLADATETDVTPVQDPIVTISNTHFLPQQDWFMHLFMGMAATLPRFRFNSPSLLQVTTPFMSPLETALTPGTRPGIADYRQYPMLLKALEECILLGQQTSGGAARVNALAAVAIGALTPAPLGQLYTIRGTSVTAAVANTWTQLVMVWQSVLPAGLYSVIGGVAFGASDYAFRVIFEDSRWRGGGPALATENLIPAPQFQKGGMGEWGRFNANRMPGVEILCNGTTASHVVYLDIVRVG